MKFVIRVIKLELGNPLQCKNQGQRGKTDELWHDLWQIQILEIWETKEWVYTWIMPLTRHAPFLQKTIFGSSGCRDLSSSLTSSLLALWSLVNCSAMTLFDLLKQPIIARESPALAIYNVLPQITPTRQHDPLAEISGFEWRFWRTWPRNSSSVAKNAFLKTSSDIDSLSCTIPVWWGEIN